MLNICFNFNHCCFGTKQSPFIHVLCRDFSSASSRGTTVVIFNYKSRMTALVFVHVHIVAISVFIIHLASLIFNIFVCLNIFRISPSALLLLSVLTRLRPVWTARSKHFRPGLLVNHGMLLGKILACQTQCEIYCQAC